MPKWSDLTVEDRLDELQEELNRLKLFVPAHGASHRFGAEDTMARLPALIRVRKAANQTIGTGATTKILVDTLVFGPRGPQLLWDSTNSQIIVLETGIYLCGGGMLWAVNATGERNALIYINGVYAAEGRAYGHASIVPLVTLSPVPLRLVTGDTIDLRAYQDSGGNLVCSADVNYPFLAVAYMSPTT